MRAPRQLFHHALGSVLVVIAAALGLLAGAVLVDGIINSGGYRSPGVRVVCAALARIGGLTTINDALGWLRGTAGRSVQLGEMSSALTVLLLVAWMFLTFVLGQH